MTALTTEDPKELMRRHQEVLQGYARRSLLHGGSLSEQEDADRLVRVREFMALGAAFRLTKAELVVLAYRGLFGRKAPCGCPSCIARQEA